MAPMLFTPCHALPPEEAQAFLGAALRRPV